MPITLNHVTHCYAPGTPFARKALDGIDLTLADGSFVGLIGHTGSGKSTLVQHLNGLLLPTEGTVTVFDVTLPRKGADLKTVRRRVGMVFQYPEHQLFEETVEKDIAFGPKNIGLSEEEIVSRVRRAAERVGLDFDEVRERSPFALSGGQRRRVAIAGVLAMEPDFLVLDEPTAGLDPQGREELLSLITALHDDNGTGILLVSHSMNDIARVAERVLVMENGQIVMDGTPAEVFARGAELQKLGLDIPDGTRLALALQARGMTLPDGLFDAEEIAEALLAQLGGGTDAK